MKSKDSVEELNIFAEVHKIVMTDKNAMAFAKMINTPLKDLADIFAHQFEELLGTVAGNIHDVEQLRKAVQVFIVQHAITTPMVILRTLFKFK